MTFHFASFLYLSVCFMATPLLLTACFQIGVFIILIRLFTLRLIKAIKQQL